MTAAAPLPTSQRFTILIQKLELSSRPSLATEADARSFDGPISSTGGDDLLLITTANVKTPRLGRGPC